MSSVVEDGFNITHTEINEVLGIARKFILNASNQEIQSKGPGILQTFESLVNYYQAKVPPKKPYEIIGSEFNKLSSEKDEIYSYGIEFRWLEERLDCSKINLNKEIPWQTRIGIGHHAGRLELEESFLLRDAFYLFVNAKETYNNMFERAGEIKELETKEISSYNKYLTYANLDVATYSRLTMVSMLSFIEAFVNSVGYDYFLRNKEKLTEKEIELLNGKKGRRYLSIETKLEKFPKIIRSVKISPIIISDVGQRREPFISFIDNLKPIRNSSMHYSPKKESIWRRPKDWLKSAESSTQLCVSVAREFWLACYPNRSMPFYLFELDYDNLMEEAKNRLHAKNNILNVPLFDNK